MTAEIVYVELKSGHADNGPAWIGKIRRSKSGRMLYFNNQAFRPGSGISGNYFDVESGDEYWISGVKKDQHDRHWAGSGQVTIDKAFLAEYLALIGIDKIDSKRYRIVELDNSDAVRERVRELQNRKLE